jgi:hypothetical protein
MLIRWILIPVFVLVFCTFIGLYRARGRGGAVDRAALPPDHLDVLFYVLIALLIETRHADLIALILACVYAVLRVFPRFDTRSNSAAWKRSADTVSILVLFVMWVIYLLEVLLLI